MFRVFPIPGSAQNNQNFLAAIYAKPPLYTTSTADSSALPVFPANIMIAGLYAKALLEENGGEPTQEYQAAFATYIAMRKEALNRYNADTGNDLFLVPTGSRWG